MTPHTFPRPSRSILSRTDGACVRRDALNVSGASRSCGAHCRSQQLLARVSHINMPDHSRQRVLELDRIHYSEGEAMKEDSAAHERALRPSGCKRCACTTSAALRQSSMREVSRPVPGAGQVLVRVKAAGVGPWDAWVRSGKSVLPQPLPLVLGDGPRRCCGGGWSGCLRFPPWRCSLWRHECPVHRRLCRVRRRRALP